MCGDATNREDIFRLLDGEHVNLVLTDPPYGVRTHRDYNFTDVIGDFGGHRDHMRKTIIIGDTNTDTAREHYAIIKDNINNLIIWGGNYFSDFLPPSKGWLVWYKRQTLWNHADCELAWTSLKTSVKLYDQLWSGACRSGSHKLNPRPCVHPTQKPVELHAKILEDFTQPDDVILDCFGGSGTTLIAAEITGRTCYMMEISPEYCGIIRERYCKLKEDYPIAYQ